MSLERLVYDFRRAIEAAKKNNEPGEFFRKFPDGQCDHACDILAQYLIDKEIRSINIMNGFLQMKLMSIKLSYELCSVF